MNERWNLDSLYHGFSDPDFAGDLQALKVACGRFDTFTKSLEEMEPSHALRQGIESLEQIASLSNSLGEYASLRQAADTGDAEASSALGFQPKRRRQRPVSSLSGGASQPGAACGGG